VSGEVNYDVNAWLRTKGSFKREVGQAARAAETFGRSYTSMSSRLVAGGNAIKGSFGGIATALAGSAALLGGGMLAAGVGQAVGEGLEFLNTMESSKMTVATIYQMFGLASKEQDVLNGKVTEFKKNLEQSEAVQARIRKIAETAPGGFAEINQLYQFSAAGMMGATQDLERQMQMLQKMSVMAGVVDNDFKQLGADFGRMLSGQAGADIRTFQVLKGPIEEATMAVMGLKKAPADLAQAFNKLDAGSRLKILEKVLGKIPKEAVDEWSNTFEALTSAADSSLKDLKGTLAMPLRDSIKTALKGANAESGMFGPSTFRGLQEAALFAGEKMAGVFDRAWAGLAKTADHVAKNWRDIATNIRDAGFAAGLAIKSAVAVAVSRYIMGTAIAAAGKAMAGGRALVEAGKPIAAWIGKQQKTTHAGMARGMAGKGSGILGGMGRGMGKAMGSDGGLGFGRGLDKGLLKLMSLVTTVGSLATVAGMAGAALGGVAVLVAGAAAFFISNWRQISGSLAEGLQNGTITLVPLITAMYTFWLRLRLVGEAIFGATSAAGTMNTGITFMASAVDMASGTLSWFVKGLSIMVGAWGLLKIGMLGIMSVILGIIDVANSLGAVSDETAARAKRNYDKFSSGIDDTFHKADQLASAAEAIGKAQLSPLDIKKSEARAAELSKTLGDLLSGKGKDGKGRSGKAAVKIAKVELNIDMRDPDPDRLFGQLVPKLERMADRRVQPYEALEDGA
jgi:hypothetical protein